MKSVVPRLADDFASRGPNGPCFLASRPQKNVAYRNTTYNITLQKNIAELAKSHGLTDQTPESLAALGSGQVRVGFTGSGPNEFTDFCSFLFF